MAEPYWTVVVAQSQRLDLVGQLLDREGFECYAPKIKKNGRAAPLFPGYLMVRIVLRWYPIRWTPGVLRVLMTGDRPAKLDDAIVAEIKGREVRGFVKLPKDPNALEKGDTVLIKSGLFAGRLGIYDGMSSGQRELVLLEWLGQTVTAQVPVGTVMRV